MYSVVKTVVGGECYYIFDLDTIMVGKCILECVDDKCTIKYFEIDAKRRGNDLSTVFYNLVEKKLIDNKIKTVSLIAEELSDRHNKLVNLYTKWGFKQSSKERFKYNGDYLVRCVPMIKVIIE